MIQGMKPLEIALHAAALGGCTLLGAGFWTLSQPKEPGPATNAPVVAPSRSAEAEAEVRTLAREVEALRLEMAQMRQERAARPAVALVAPAGGPDAATGQTPAATLQALEDPAVQEKLQALMDDHQRQQWDARRQEGGRQMDRQTQRLASELKLNDSQAPLFTDLMGKVRTHYDDLRKQVREKALTTDQAKSDLQAYYAQTDIQAQAFMSPDQFKQYQEIVQPFREMSITWGFDGHRGRGQGRDSGTQPAPTR